MAACPSRLVVFGAVWSSLLAAQSPVLPTDLHRIRSVSALDLSSDGSKAVFAVRSIDGEEYRNRLYSIDLTRPATPVPLTGPAATTPAPPSAPTASGSLSCAATLPRAAAPSFG